MFRGKSAVSDKRLIKSLESYGWYFVGQKGSHRHYKHPVIKGKLTIPKNCTKNVLLQIRKQTGLDIKDLV